MVAVVVVLPGRCAGATKAVAEAGGNAVLAGSGTAAAAKELLAARRVRCAELGDFAPGAWAVALAPLVASAAVVLLPASPDGPRPGARLAHVLGRPLLAGATRSATTVPCWCVGGLVSEVHPSTGRWWPRWSPASAARPGAGEATVDVVAVEPPPLDTVPATPAERSAERPPATGGSVAEPVRPCPVRGDGARRRGRRGDIWFGRVRSRRRTARPWSRSCRRTRAPSIWPTHAASWRAAPAWAGPSRSSCSNRWPSPLSAAFGATQWRRTSAGAPHDRYIGTTGVAVDPDLYVALGISGAVQHVTGLGQPRHVIAVNTDASAPMMALADLAS